MLICSVAVFLLLPFTQYISGSGEPTIEIRSVDITLPPPPPPPPEPPPPEEQEQEEPPPELQRTPPQLSLSQMELALNPGIGDAMAGAFEFSGFGVQPDAVGDLDIFDVADLDRPPRRTRTVPPVYPADLRRAHVQGEVTLILVIDQTGRAKVERVAESTNREFVQAAVTAAEQCQWEPPTKDGEAVRARYSMRVPFRLQ
jgi:protein TonB